MINLESMTITKVSHNSLEQSAPLRSINFESEEQLFKFFNRIASSIIGGNRINNTSIDEIKQTKLPDITFTLIADVQKYFAINTTTFTIEIHKLCKSPDDDNNWVFSGGDISSCSFRRNSESIPYITFYGGKDNDFFAEYRYNKNIELFEKIS